MPEYVPPSTTCSTCGGDGRVDDEICLTCLGTGAEPVTDKMLLVQKKIIEKLDDILDKCNDIFEKLNE